MYKRNLGPSAISDILKEINGCDDGIYLPKTLFNANERSLDLLSVAQGILKEDTDADKLIKMLEM
jgi:hypothetical protein